MLEMASFLKYVNLYLTSEWGRFHVGHSVVDYGDKYEVIFITTATESVTGLTV
jgi:hypothetical protein